MKYYLFSADYNIIPDCKNNMYDALVRIGRANILKVPLRYVRKGICEYDNSLSRKQLYNLGVLNVKKQLNRHLGKSGKFTNRMIKRSATVRCKGEDGIVELGTYFLKHKDDFIQIIVATYILLYAVDPSFCKQLLGVVENDSYLNKDDNQNIPSRTICPIQSNIIIRARGITSDREVVRKRIEDFVKWRL